MIDKDHIPFFIAGILSGFVIVLLITWCQEHAYTFFNEYKDLTFGLVSGFILGFLIFNKIDCIRR